MTKRIFDISCAALGILVLLPFLAAIAIIVKISSKGPVFYRQIRVGKNGQDFSLLKFRTMYINADLKGLLTVGARDPRVTSIGYILRKYKLDELPQLLNVLEGSMSIVGPRPEVRKYVDLYTQEQLEVLRVKPGITDAASIEFRNENDLLAESTDPEVFYIEEVMPKKLRLNKVYAEHNNLGIDILLIVQTLKKLVSP